MIALDRLVPRNRHRAATLRERLPDPLDGVALSDPRLDRERTRDGRVQFATLGRGNHFLEFQRDDEGALWLTVHSGSRAMGQAVTQHHLARAETDSIGLRFLHADSPAGRSYRADADWCVAYAEASRLAMLDAVCEWLAANLGVVVDVGSGIRCHHNFVRRETHDGEELWVHRKGALSAEERELGIIPGSMGAPTFHVEGRGCERSLRSSSHGAGRALPRSEARRRISRRALRDSMKGIWYDPRLEARLIDEAPAAYKDIRKVMKAQRELTRIVRRLEPVLVYKGG